MDNLMRSLRVVVDQATGATTVLCALTGCRLKFASGQVASPSQALELAAMTWFSQRNSRTSYSSTDFCAIPLPPGLRHSEPPPADPSVTRWQKVGNWVFLIVCALCLLGAAVLCILPE